MSEEQRNRWQGITDAVDELKQNSTETFLLMETLVKPLDHPFKWWYN